MLLRPIIHFASRERRIRWIRADASSVMDLVSAITSMDQAQAIGSVQMAVAKKMLDMQQFQGDSAVQLIQAAGQSMNKAGDALVASATGLGGQLDTYA